GPEVLQAHLRRYPKYENAVVSHTDIAVTDADATEATSQQWARAQEARALIPDAVLTLRTHRVTWKRDLQAPSVVFHGLLVVRTVGRGMTAPAATASTECAQIVLNEDRHGTTTTVTPTQKPNGPCGNGRGDRI